MPCPFCKGKKGGIDTAFHNPDEHLVITIKNGHTHVHGPFAKELVMREMLKSLIAEMENSGMPFRLSTDERIGS